MHGLTYDERSLIMKWQNNRPVYNAQSLFPDSYFGEKKCNYMRSFAVTDKKQSHDK